MIKLILVLILLITISACSYREDDECLNIVRRKMVTDIQDSNVINFEKELNCFEWDSMMLLNYDFNPDQIEYKTGIDINGYRLMGINYLIQSDFYTYLVLIHNKKVIASIDVSGGVYIENLLSELNNNEFAVIAKKDATFKIYKTENTFLDGRTVYSMTFYDKNLIEKYKRI